MPSSNHSQISKIINIVVALDPKSVLDIGVGFGKYGFLCREYLELWDGREDYKNFLRKIDGIEAFKEYITPVHDFVYNHIYIGNAFNILDQIDFSYDLVLLVDVLEHFEKKDGEELLKKILKKNKGVILSIPKDIGVQEDVFSNVYEEHKSSWSIKELSRFGETFFVYDVLSHIVYIGNSDDVKKIKIENSLKKKTKEFLLRAPFLPSLYRFIRKILIHR